MTATNPSPRVVRDCTLPWSKVDTTVMRDPTLSLGAKALYGVLTTFVDRNSRASDTRPDGPDVPTRGALADCLGKSRDTVDRLTAELEAYRLNGAPILVVERRRDPDRPKSNLPSVYRLLDHEHWDALAAERHAARQSARGSRKPAATTSEGGRMDAARGSRKSAATPSRIHAAVPITTQKTTTHRAREDVNIEASATGSGAGGGGVEDSENFGALREVLRGDAYEALTLDERRGLAAAVRRLTDAGWTTVHIRARRPDRRVNASTTHPATHIRQALETLAAESAPSARPTASATRPGADDCGQCGGSGWATVEDGTHSGRAVRCSHDGTVPAAPEPTSEPARADEARAMFAELVRAVDAA